ncbi:HprK-related kinase B [Methylomarinum vadi]|uniref:HprK-related kinase B n=1 Tax=Methylomarinum vadi TaxID=438855 RepID=UPI0005695C2E|nr:HprK-related kinase B [Methylomarinum vadi]
MELTTVKSRLLRDARPDAAKLTLQCAGYRVTVLSNSAALLGVLRDYFHPFLCDATDTDITVQAIESPIVQLPYPFRDWKREAGKSGRKDAYFDFTGGRLIRKVRTGMLFLQSESDCIAAGPCLAYPNQVINFINAQIMNRLQHRNWLICHAAAVVKGDRAYAIAGFSGGGKSTFMLHLLEDRNIDFLTNDRLFIRRRQHSIDAVGIAKLPRINPGTIVHNPRLHKLIPERQRQHLLALPRQQLWQLEDKYDVDIDDCYGKDRIADRTPLQAFIVLNWRHDSEEATKATEVNLSERRELLAAIMKSPGPFYQQNDGRFLTGDEKPNEAAYLAELGDIPVYEVTGRVDFKALQDFFHQHIIRETGQ